MNFGHYTAYAKNSISGKWYEYNDSKVSKRHPHEVCSSSAYVLFYKLRDFYPNGDTDFEKIKKVPLEMSTEV